LKRASPFDLCKMMNSKTILISMILRESWCTKLACVCIGSLLTGCGGPTLVPVSGTVTLDGQPLAAAYVTFEPVEGELELVSTGVTDSSGRYTLTCGDEPGAIAGTHRIQLTTIAPGSHADELSALPQDKVPSHYQDGTLAHEVPEEGTETADFPLVTRR
jgi:hypothetical protein